VQQLQLELAVGDTVQIGNQLITVIEIDEGGISIRIDDADFGEFAPCAAADAVPRK
jgi:hypothetical protein